MAKDVGGAQLSSIRPLISILRVSLGQVPSGLGQARSAQRGLLCCFYQIVVAVSRGGLITSGGNEKIVLWLDVLRGSLALANETSVK